MTETGSYNLCQQAFVLSLLSNQLSRLNGDKPDSKANLEQRLAAFLSGFLSDSKTVGYLGQWEVVWGPAVFSVGGIPDNTTYIARRAGPQPVYVLATAGTNGASTFAINDEDGQVGTTTAWTTAFKEDLDGRPLLGDYGSPTADGSPALSTGTAVGVRAVLATAPAATPHSPSPQRLFEYLRGVQSPDATLIVTGHSLGGALSPTLALALFTQGGPLQKDQWGQVYVLPTAGATPGNQDLSDAFAQVFPGVPAQVGQPDLARQELWNRNIANSFDFVPLAWVPEHMERIKPDLLGFGGIYPHLRWGLSGTQIAVRIGVGIAEGRAKTGAASTPYGGAAGAGPYATLPSVTFACQEIDPRASIGSIGDYLKHWLHQHVDAYILQIFKVGDLLDPAESREALSGAGLALLAGAISAEPAVAETRGAQPQ